MDPSPSEKKKPPMKADQKGNRNVGHEQV
jgi:hypothetical protein